LNLNSTSRFRVIFESREHYRLMDENKNVFPAEVSGYFRHSARSWPVVGDWVVGTAQPGDWILIEEVLPRKGVLSRTVSESVRPQILAANVDVLFVVTSANADFNLNRIERYIAMATAGGVPPVIVINKIELAESAKALLYETETRFTGVKVIAVSAAEKLNLESLQKCVTPGATVAFVGSSGVGKSSLTNILTGGTHMAVSEIREDDSRGRHTTTHRELQCFGDNCAVIDSPGLRTVGLTEGADLSSVFAEISATASNCRFRDCQHDTEPGCAVKAAVESGEIAQERMHNYKKLGRELAFEERKQSKAAMSEAKKEWAKRSKAIKKGRIVT
jgi:ribosome biogenesis GTPase